jgi:phage shock protein PspC (stress-responsive transcriptional regulator)
MLVTVNTTKHSGISIENLASDFWATRPRRPRQGRMVAGVAAGIGRRYGIDPVIVRVALVVTTVYGGAGILLYLLGWLALADENDEASPLEAMAGRGHSSMSRGFTILLCVLCLPAFASLFNNQFGFFSGLFSAAALVGALFLLHRNRAELGVPGAPTTTSGGSMTAPGYAPGAAAADWDPLGASPLLWDLHDPNEPVTTQVAATEPQDRPVAVRPRRRHSAIGGVTMGIAVLTAAALIVGKAYDPWLTWPHILGIVGGVLAGGLVVGAFARGGRGLIVPTVLVGVAAVALTNSPNGGGSGFGDLRATPVNGLDASYSRSFGDVRLDLTKLKLDKDKPARTTVSVDAGTARVTLPADANVDVTCTSNVGSVRCLNQRGDWHDISLHDVDNVDGAAGTIVLEVHSGAGDIEVDRG